jgi:hypothetical protein
MKKLNHLHLLFILLVFHGCHTNSNKKAAQNFYTSQDYYSVPKYDVHIHIFTKSPFFPENCKKENYRLLSVNVNAPDLPAIEEQQDMAIYQLKKFPGEFNYATTFSVDDWNDLGWENRVLSYLKSSFEKGAVAVKVWKNIGMTLKDKDGKFVMIDNARFDIIIDFIAINKITLSGDLGDRR